MTHQCNQQTLCKTNKDTFWMARIFL